MTPSGIKQQIGITTVIAACCLTSLWIVMADMPSGSTVTNVKPKGGTTAEKEEKSGNKEPGATAWDVGILTARLQGPPKPEEPVKPVQVAAPVVIAPTLPFQLTGTILEDDVRFAVLKDNSGKEFVVREGESVPAPHDAIVVKSVQEQSARFTISGTEQELTLKTKNLDLLFQ
jgi:hypothetical protein